MYRIGSEGPKSTWDTTLSGRQGTENESFASTVATLEDLTSASRPHAPQTNPNVISTGIFASESSQDDFNKASQTGVAMKARLGISNK